MKKILIGLTLLTSMSSFASTDCLDLTITIKEELQSAEGLVEEFKSSSFLIADKVGKLFGHSILQSFEDKRLQSRLLCNQEERDYLDQEFTKLESSIERMLLNSEFDNLTKKISSIADGSRDQDITVNQYRFEVVSPYKKDTTQK